MFKHIMLAAATAAAFAVASVAAQQNGLVNVNVTDIEILRNSLNNNDVRILNNLLNNNQIAVPVSAQEPIGVAANVCNTTVAVLSATGSGGTCGAQQASRALGQAFSRQQLQR